MQVGSFAMQPLAAHNPETPAFIGGLLRSGLGRSGLALDSCGENAKASHGKDHPVPLALAIKTSVADSPWQAALAHHLVRKRYRRAGYHMVEDTGRPFPGPERAPHYFPIVAHWGGRVVGTVTLGVDSPAGLMVDDAHKDTADAIRAKGGRLCELVRLAVEDDVHSKAVLASLLQCVYTTCTGVFDLTDVVVEVVPPHAPFYCRLLGFSRASEIRLCERVGGVASVVLTLERSELERRLRSLAQR